MVQQAIESVLSQSWSDYELIVVDDGSTDNTEEILQSYGSTLRIITQNQQGVSAARNSGIQAGDSRFIAFLDSDDIWHPEKLAKQHAYMTATSYPISQTEEIWIRKGKRVNPARKHRKEEGDIFIPSLKRCLISPSAVILARDLFTTHGLFDENLPAAEDYDLWLRITATTHVGLLQEHLITRFAGHDDQLSERYWGMDRFRVYAMLKLLQNETLTKERKEATLQVVIQKLRVLYQGARKRQKPEHLFYEECITLLREGLYMRIDATRLVQEPTLP